MTILKTAVSALSAELALIRAKIEIAKGNWSRFPAGSTKGGQFAPKGTSGFGAAKAPSFMFPGVGTMFKPSGPPKGAKPHPKVDENGKPVTINVPTKASDRSTWRDKNATATWTPGSKTPDILHGVPLKPWKAPTTTEGWSKVAGQNPKLDESLPFIPSPGKSIGAGVVIMEPDGRVWITKPTNEFGGYKHTFPKGTAERGLSLQANAIKEAWEESGLKVQIVGVLGDFERTTSKARFYLARRVGGTPTDMGWESQAMRLAPIKNANSLLNMGVDRSIIANVKGVRIVKAGAPSPAKAGNWQKQPRWPSGSALGGQWKSYDANGMPLPPKLGSATNPTYAKAADAAYKAAVGGDLSVAEGVLGKFQAAATDYAATGGKGINFHGKAKAATHQYVADLIGAVGTKTIKDSAPAAGGIAKLSSFGQTGTKPGGSNPGGMYNDAAGNAYLIKGNLQLVNGNVSQAVSDDRARNEVLASHLMTAAGVGAPDMKLVELEGKHGGGLGVASKWTNGQNFDPSNKLHVAAAQSDFAVHAWLANYDVLGASFDNTKIVGGKAVCIDPGGAVAFRAQGMPKTDFSKDAKEFMSMRDPSINANGAKIYGAMTKAQLVESAKKLATIDDATIKALVDQHGPASESAKADLVAKLQARKQYIFGAVGLSSEGKDPTPVAPSMPKKAPTATAAPATATAVPANQWVGPKSTAGVQHMQATYTLQDGKSNKFWGVTVSGNTLVTHYGKIGSKGSTTTKTFGSDLEANAAATKLSHEKHAKGYGYAGKNSAPQPVLDALSQAGFAAPAAAPAKAPASTPVSSGPPPEFMPSDDNAEAFRREPGASGKFPSPPKLSATSATKNSTATLQNAVDLIHESVQNGQPVVVTPTASNIKIFIPALGEHITLGKPPKTANGEAVLAYAQAAVKHHEAAKDAEAKAPSAYMVEIAALGSAAGKASAPMALPAKPPAGKLSSPSNPNKTLLQKVDNITGHAEQFAAGTLSKDAALALIGAEKFGSNSYGKAASAYQQSLVAAISGGKADPMGHHPVNAVMPAQAPAAVKPKAAKKPVFDPSKLSVPPSFVKWGTTGQPGPSSSVAVNQANQDAVQSILQTAKSGQIAAIKALKIPVINKTTGEVTGSVPALDHPSQWVKGYAQQAINEIEQQLNPPKRFRFEDGNPVAALSTAYPTHKGSLTSSAVKKLGYYVVLGEPGSISNKDVGITQTLGYKNGKLKNATYAAKAQALIAKMPKQQKDALKSYTGSGYGAINGSLWKGNPSGAAKSAAEALKSLSHEIQPGTVLSRKISMHGSDLQDLIKAQGKILQEPAVSSTAINPDIWSGNVHFKMTVGPGVKGLWVGAGSDPDGGSLSKHGSEQEMLLPPNTRMLVQRVVKQDYKDPDGFNAGEYRVEVLILPTN